MPHSCVIGMSACAATTARGLGSASGRRERVASANGRSGLEVGSTPARPAADVGFLRRGPVVEAAARGVVAVGRGSVLGHGAILVESARPAEAAARECAVLSADDVRLAARAAAAEASLVFARSTLIRICGSVGMLGRRAAALAAAGRADGRAAGPQLEGRGAGDSVRGLGKTGAAGAPRSFGRERARCGCGGTKRCAARDRQVDAAGWAAALGSGRGATITLLRMSEV